MTSIVSFIAAPLLGAELQWGSARPARAPAAAAVVKDFSVRQAGWDDVPAAAAPSEGGRSVVVRRDGERAAKPPQPNPTFDPFDQFQDAAEMPATEPVAEQPKPVEPAFDPFEETDELETAAPVAEDQSSAAELEQAFSEPPTEERQTEAPEAERPADDDKPGAADELEQAGDAIDRELMRRDVERGAAGELPSADEAADEVKPDEEMADELVAPEPTPESEPAPPEGDDDYLNRDPADEDWLTQPGDEDVRPQPTPEEIELRRQQIEEERRVNQEKCEELYDAVREDSIKNIDLSIRLKGNEGEDFPFECPGRGRPFEPRSWSQITYLWKASGLCHKPLYFEQAQLERYGHDWGPALQPVMSGVHFFGTLPVLPYKMGIQTPNECVYTLGYYRPGSCAPYMIEAVPFTWRAAAFEAGAWTGGAFAIP